MVWNTPENFVLIDFTVFVCLSLMTTNLKEVEKFSKIAREWWNPNGKFKPLHLMNPIRTQFIRKTFVHSHISNNSNISNPRHIHEDDTLKPFESLKFLDVGCGGGLLSESLARLGAHVTALDASKESISIAQHHSSIDSQISPPIEYIVGDLSTLLTTSSIKSVDEENHSEQSNSQFDAVFALEIIEHVDNLGEFLKQLCQLLKPHGSLYVSTLNKTIRSFLFGIIGAEYITGLVPKGTHDWQKFVDPVQLQMALRSLGLEMKHATGIWYDPIWSQFHFTDDMSVNYIVHAVKSSQEDEYVKTDNNNKVSSL